MMDLELLGVLADPKVAYPDAELDGLWHGILINQFHDILPGTCIPRAHDEAKAQVSEVIEKANVQTLSLLASEGSGQVTVVNPTSFLRNDVIYLEPREGMRIAGGYPQQFTETLAGGKKLAVTGVTLPPYGSVVLEWEEGIPDERSPFGVSGRELVTPFAKVVFDERGFIKSFVDTGAGRRRVPLQHLPDGGGCSVTV